MMTETQAIELGFILWQSPDGRWWATRGDRWAPYHSPVNLEHALEHQRADGKPTFLEVGPRKSKVLVLTDLWGVLVARLELVLP